MTKTPMGLAVVAFAVLAAACGDSAVSTSPTDANNEAPAGAQAAESTGAESTEGDLPRVDDSQARALDNANHDSFPAPLVDLNLIRSGGPPPDGIPPIDSPNFDTVADTTFLEDNEPILAFEFNGEVRGYPIQIMTWHEIVNDTVGGVPVTITFCPLCNSATAYPRELADGTVVDFGTSGRLFNSSLLMYDRQTGSLWTHFDGRAVVGSLVGHELELLPLQMVSWERFRTTFPEALVLNTDTGANRSYGSNPYAGYDNAATSPFLFVGETDGRLAAKQRVVAVRGESTKVYITDDLATAAVVHSDKDGEGIVIFHEPGTASALDDAQISDGRDIGATGVFLTLVDGQDLTFEASGPGQFTDNETSSTWDIFGTATEGPLAGTRLTSVEHLDTFWFAIAAFTPDAEIVTLP